MSKSNPLSFRIEREIKEALIRAAKDDRRSVSSLVEFILKHWLVEQGYLSGSRFAPRKRLFSLTMRDGG